MPSTRLQTLRLLPHRDIYDVLGCLLDLFLVTAITLVSYMYTAFLRGENILFVDILSYIKKSHD